MVAIAIMAFLMLGVTYTIDQSSQTKTRVTEEDNDFLQVELALARIQKDFQQIFTPLFYSHQYNPKVDPFNYGKKGEEIFNPNERYRQHRKFAFVSYEGHPVPIFFSNDPTNIEFLTLSNRRKIENLKESHLAWVRYYLRPMDKESIPADDPRREGSFLSLVREYQPLNPWTSEDSFETAKTFVLLDFIKELQFEFWSPQERRFVSRLQEVKPQGEHLLRGLKLSLTVVERGNYERQIVRLFRSNWPLFEAERWEELYQKNPRNQSLGTNQGPAPTGGGGAR